MPDTPAESLLSATRLAQVSAAVCAKAHLAPGVGATEGRDATPREARVQYVVDKSGDAFQQAKQSFDNWNNLRGFSRGAGRPGGVRPG